MLGADHGGERMSPNAASKQDILDLLGIDLGPVRLKCALLSLKVLKAGVYGLGAAGDDLVG